MRHHICGPFSSTVWEVAAPPGSARHSMNDKMYDADESRLATDWKTTSRKKKSRRASRLQHQLPMMKAAPTMEATEQTKATSIKGRSGWRSVGPIAVAVAVARETPESERGDRLK